MQKFDVWVYNTKPGSEEFEEEFFGTFEGYLPDIITAVLALRPRAIGIYTMPEDKG